MDLLEVASERKRRVAIYIRVSTAEQKIDGYSLGAQKKKLTDYVNNNAALNLQTKDEWLYEDTHTGSDLNREKLNLLREDVRAGKFDAVLVWKIDRLSRSLQHLLSIFEELQKSNVNFISVQENIDFKGPIGTLIFQMFGAIAQFERELIKGRTQMGKVASAILGNYTGPNVPYGYKPLINKGGRGKTLEIIPQQKAWIREMYEWYIYEGLGDGQIANKLNKLKVQRIRWEKDKETGKWSSIIVNKPWTDKIVTPIFTNPIYRGEYLANDKDDSGNLLPSDKWTVVHIPPCVSEFTFQLAQGAREGRTGGSTGTDYLLSGKLKDMTLDSPRTFTGAKRSGGGFSYRRKQFNKDGEHFPVFEVPGRQMEEYVWSKVLAAMKEPNMFIQHYLSREFADPTKIQQMESQLDTLRLSRVTAEQAIEKIEDAHDCGSYSREKMDVKVSAQNTKIAEIDNQIEEIEDSLRLLTSAEVEIQKLKDASAQVKHRMDKLDRKNQRVLCNLFVDTVEMRRVELPNDFKKKKKWKIQAEVCFRFNPDKFAEKKVGVESKNDIQKPRKGLLTPKKDLNGGPGWT
ncbi:MAG: recombinase family protein [Myxococcaceae bacterium]